MLGLGEEEHSWVFKELGQNSEVIHKSIYNQLLLINCKLNKLCLKVTHVIEWNLEIWKNIEIQFEGTSWRKESKEWIVPIPYQSIIING